MNRSYMYSVVSIVGIFLVILSGFMFKNDSDNLMQYELGLLFKQLCVYEASLSFAIYVVLKIITKSYNDKTNIHSSRIMVSFHFAYVITISTISIYFSMSIIPLIPLIISEIIFIYASWKTTEENPILL